MERRAKSLRGGGGQCVRRPSRGSDVLVQGPKDNEYDQSRKRTPTQELVQVHARECDFERCTIDEVHPGDEKSDLISIPGHHIDDFPDVGAGLGIIDLFRINIFVIFANGSREVLPLQRFIINRGHKEGADSDLSATTEPQVQTVCLRLQCVNQRKFPCSAVPVVYLQQCGKKRGKCVDVRLCPILWSGVIDCREDPLEEERAGVGESDTDERQEEIPNHITRIGSPEFPNNVSVAEVFEQRSERAGGECRAQLPYVVLVQGVVSTLLDKRDDPVEGDPIPEGAIIFG